MVNADKLGAKFLDLGDNRADHVAGFFAALGEILPERGGNRALKGFGVNYNIGRNRGGAFA